MALTTPGARDKTAYIYSTSHCRWVETNGNAILDAVEGLGVG
jgi:hypothetical protein